MMKFLKANDGLGWQAKKYEEGRDTSMNLGNSSQQKLVSDSTSLIIDLFQVAIEVANEANDVRGAAVALGNEVVDIRGGAEDVTNGVPASSKEVLNLSNMPDLPVTPPHEKSITLIDRARLKRGTLQDPYLILRHSQDAGYYFIDEAEEHKEIDPSQQIDEAEERKDIDTSQQYDFVIMPDGQIRIGKGHGEVSGLTSVLYAGEIRFSVQADGKKIVESWNNKSGKYKLSSMLACKVTVFPYDKFTAHIPSPPASPVLSGQIEEQFMRMSLNS